MPLCCEQGAMSDVASEARTKLAALEKTLKQRDAEVKNASQAVVDANRARDRAEQETDSLRKKHERLRSFTDEQVTAISPFSMTKTDS